MRDVVDLGGSLRQTSFAETVGHQLDILVPSVWHEFGNVADRKGRSSAEVCWLDGARLLLEAQMTQFGQKHEIGPIGGP